MELRHLLVETHSHMPPEGILEGLSDQDAMRRFANLPHSIAEIVAHMDFWQSWFLKRCRGVAEPVAASAALGWPAVADGAWTAVRDRFLAGLEEAAALASNTSGLEQPIQPALEFPPMAHYTVADALAHLATHNAHHAGQIVTIRQLLGSWPPPAGSFTW